MRVLLDSNVWLAILTTDGQCRRTWRTLRRQSEIYVSPDILTEIEEKLQGKLGFSARHAHLLTRFVRRQTMLVEITAPPPRVCRDAEDDLVLEAAITARCEYLVTGDNDLLVLKQFNALSIVTPGEFAKLAPAG